MLGRVERGEHTFVGIDFHKRSELHTVMKLVSFFCKVSLREGPRARVLKAVRNLPFRVSETKSILGHGKIQDRTVSD